MAAAPTPSPAWSRTTPWQRAEVLDRAGTEVLARADELGDLLAREEGKTLPEARGEVVRAAPDPQVLRRRRAAAARPGARLRASGHRGHRDPRAGGRRQRHHAVELPDRHPRVEDRAGAGVRQHGRVQARRPRPGERVGARRHPQPRRAARRACSTSCSGRGSQVGPGAHRRPARHGVTFTGSVDTGRGILARRPRTGAKVQLELGGKNPLVVTDHADLAVAVECAVQGGFGSTGQRCTASSILVVTDGVHDAFVGGDAPTACARGASAMPVPAGIDMGPVVDESQLAAGPALPRRRARRGRRGRRGRAGRRSAHRATTWRRRWRSARRSATRSTARRSSAR